MSRQEPAIDPPEPSYYQELTHQIAGIEDELRALGDDETSSEYLRLMADLNKASHELAELEGGPPEYERD